jgi:RNA polymerase sigma factor (sigma-70 family)
MRKSRQDFGIPGSLDMSSETGDGSWVVSDRSVIENVSLVNAIAAGDRDAEQVFVSRFQPRVRAMLQARTRNSDHVADLLQDVLIESICALRRGQVREPSKLTAFVLGIARNLLNGHFRGAARQPEPLEFPDQLPDLSSAGLQLEDQNRQAIALRAISSLDLVDRTILQMTLVEGLKPGAIAQRLELSSDVVRQRKLRATRKVVDFVRGQSQNVSSIHIVAGRKR